VKAIGSPLSVDDAGGVLSDHLSGAMVNPPNPGSNLFVGRVQVSAWRTSELEQPRPIGRGKSRVPQATDTMWCS
jgi:hypothetical protein